MTQLPLYRDNRPRHNISRKSPIMYKTPPLILFLLIIVAGGFSCSSAKGQITISDVPATLSSGQKQAFSLRWKQLVQINEDIKAQVAAHNAKCSNLPEDSPLLPQCREEQASLQQQIAHYRELVKQFNEDLSQAVSNPTPTSASTEISTVSADDRPALDVAQRYNPAQIAEEIEKFREALKRLNEENSTDEKERQELLEKSEATTRNAYFLGAKATLDALTAYTDRQLVTQTKQIDTERNQLINELNPDRREQAHHAFKALMDRKNELLESKEHLERVQDAVDAAEKLTSLALDKKEEESKNLLEQGWEFCDKLKLLPPGAAQAKSMVDAYYDVAVQAFCVQQINILNDTAGDRLKAITALSNKLKQLEDIRKSLK